MEWKMEGFRSGMGVPDSGASQTEFLSFTELERVISSLFDDSGCSTSAPQPETLSDFLISDKLSYFIEVSTNIMETKTKFMRLYETINRTIEDVTNELIVNLTARKDELVRELWSIKAKKVGKWDHQLSVCKEALRLLRSENSFMEFNLNFKSVAVLQRELTMVDAGEIKFEVDNYQSLVKDIRNLGTISSCIGPKWSSSCTDSFKSVTPKFLFGTAGGKPGEFCRPWGVCSDVTGRILVCDRSNHRIQIFDECGKFLLEFGKEGSEPGKFNRPCGIDVDVKCRIVVADKDNHRIQVFTYSGHFLFEFGKQGSGIGEFQYPWDVSVNDNCDIAVSDSKNHRVQLFNERGRFITLFDAAVCGASNTRTMLKFLDCPRGLAFRSDGSLLVTDFNNHKILLIAKNFRSYSTFGFEGVCPGQFFRPQGIACDKIGRIAVSDSKNYRVQVFDSNGHVLSVFGTRGNEPGQFDCPQGISFHPNLNIVVVDLNHCRVQVF